MMIPKMRWLAAGLSVVFVLGATPCLFAQSLAEVAKKEEERRKALKQTATKTYTNQDLAAVPPPPPPVPPTAGSEAEKPVAAGPEAKDKDKTEKDKGPAKDQAYWSGRMKELRLQLERDQQFAEALQTRISSLSADFVARDDPAQKARIAADKQKALTELDRLKLAIQADKKGLVDLEEEARKAGVPPGWLRS
jgi:hypothetical protein